MDEGSEREAEELKYTIRPYPITSVDSFLFHPILFLSIALTYRECLPYGTRPDEEHVECP